MMMQRRLVAITLSALVITTLQTQAGGLFRRRCIRQSPQCCTVYSEKPAPSATAVEPTDGPWVVYIDFDCEGEPFKIAGEAGSKARAIECADEILGQECAAPSNVRKSEPEEDGDGECDALLTRYRVPIKAQFCDCAVITAVGYGVNQQSARENARLSIRKATQEHGCVLWCCELPATTSPPIHQSDVHHSRMR
jgi:hypothetical protein